MVSDFRDRTEYCLISLRSCTTLNLNINFTNDSLEITAKDNGIGFESNQNFDGIGLKNMIKRAELIDSKIQLKSIENQGTTLTITYPKTQLL